MSVGGGLQQSFPLRAALGAAAWVHLQIPGDQEPCLAAPGGELLAGLGLRGFGGSYRRKAGRHGRGGFGSSSADAGLEALAELRATLGGGALGRERRWAAGNS